MIYYSLIYFSKLHSTFLKLIFQSLSLSKFQVEPVLELIDKLTMNISKTDTQAFGWRFMTDASADEKLWPTLINLGKNFIPVDCSPLGTLLTADFDRNFQNILKE